MPSVIGHPVLRELLHEEMVKTKSDATSSKKNVFFIDNGLVRFYFAKLNHGLNGFIQKRFIFQTLALINEK